ncbi:DUF2809 domain-containing protein [Mariniblastus sp.]|nr:DUF2809 domain-containing protein [Mariniblastus sp.]
MTESKTSSQPPAVASDPASASKPQHRSWFSQRWAIILACLASVVWCLAYAKYRGQISNDWIRDNGGGVPYTVFWILLVAVFWPSKRLALRISIIVVLVVCGLEFFQLYNPEPLASFRRTRFGAALLGNTFVWSDIPPYFIGGLIGWLVLRCLAVCCNGCSRES